MLDLSVKYLGLTLKNPIIVGSSDLSSTVEEVKKLESNGASAVVLKSLFEEEILLEAATKAEEARIDQMFYAELSETLDYIDLHIKEDKLAKYLKLISDAKKQVLIPVIASINCITPYEWTDFTVKIQDAGADALELNIFLNPTDLSDKNFEQTYFDIIGKVMKKVKIPVSVKISPYFAKPGLMIKKLSETGISGLVLFNRFFSPDIDINSLEVKSANKFSTETEQYNVLRWIALMSDKVKCSLAASTGIHSGESVIKQILAGADAVQVVSALYRKSPGHINVMLKDIEKWMNKKGYNYISQFKGKVSQESARNNAAFERMQFMKYFSGIE
ncbi:MAG: dihydroorotate dehydrogenase-like protein [Bacteroidales bacterium]|nr:MAG: dihydroorotate dehydrogenase-like protein [Bacteroidales bacterium]